VKTCRNTPTLKTQEEGGPEAGGTKASTRKSWEAQRKATAIVAYVSGGGKKKNSLTDVPIRNPFKHSRLPRVKRDRIPRGKEK